MATALLLALLLALPSTTLAQSRPLGGVPDGPSDLRATLGDCPAELLRRAWTEMLPLEAEAVEREVLALCTERSEAMVRFLDAQARLDGALNVVRARSSGADAIQPAADTRVEALRGEIAGLRDRIARLEGGPERPETEAALAELRDDLAAAEAELARVEESGAAAIAARADVLPPDPDETPPVARPADATAEDGLPAPLAPAAPSPETALSDAEPEPGLTVGDLPAPGAEPSGQAASLPPPRTLPPDRLAGWRLIHAVRRDGGPWQVRLQALRETAFPVPAPAPEDPDAPVLLPEFRWVQVADPPVTLAVGDGLPDGTVLLAVTREGVRLSDPAAPAADPVLLPFADAEDGAPGTLEWDFATIVEDDS